MLGLTGQLWSAIFEIMYFYPLHAKYGVSWYPHHSIAPLLHMTSDSLLYIALYSYIIALYSYIMFTEKCTIKIFEELHLPSSLFWNMPHDLVIGHVHSAYLANYSLYPRHAYRAMSIIIYTYMVRPEWYVPQQVKANMVINNTSRKHILFNIWRECILFKFSIIERNLELKPLLGNWRC